MFKYLVKNLSKARTVSAKKDVDHCIEDLLDLKGWKNLHATESESIVKAERHHNIQHGTNNSTNSVHFQKLQNITTSHLHKQFQIEKSMLK